MTISWTMVLNFTPVFAITTGEWNHSFAALRKGKECVIAIGDHVPDLIVTDYRLAEAKTGFDVISNARDVFGSDIPAIIITGDTEPTLLRSMADRGIAVQYKPLQIDLLLSFIDEINGRKLPIDTGI
jgi:CheY-like chemotaxis protein